MRGVEAPGLLPGQPSTARVQELPAVGELTAAVSRRVPAAFVVEAVEFPAALDPVEVGGWPPLLGLFAGGLAPLCLRRGVVGFGSFLNRDLRPHPVLDEDPLEDVLLLLRGENTFPVSSFDGVDSEHGVEERSYDFCSGLHVRRVGNPSVLG